MPNINPKVDLVFKKLFGVEENKDLLISPINSVVSSADQVVDVIILNPYNVQNFRSDKLSILDIKAKGENGKRFNIEIQITDEADYEYHASDKRALYYWAKLYTEQLASGEDYSSLSKAIGIHILNFISITDDERYHNCFQILEKETGEKYFTDLELHTIELKKFEGETKELSELIGKVKSTLDIWLAFLTKHNLLNRDKLPPELDDKNLKKALSVLEVMNFSIEEKEAYDDHLKWLMIEANTLKKRYEQGLLQGREEGEQTGIIKGSELAIDPSKRSSDVWSNGKIDKASLPKELKYLEKYIDVVPDRYINALIHFKKHPEHGYQSVTEFVQGVRNIPYNTSEPNLGYTRQAMNEKGELVFYNFKTGFITFYTKEGIQKSHYKPGGTSANYLEKGEKYFLEQIGKDQYQFQQELKYQNDVTTDTSSHDSSNISIDKAANANKDNSEFDDSNDQYKESSEKDKSKLDFKKDEAYIATSTLSYGKQIINGYKFDQADIVKTVQALMLIIDFTTPLWIKNLILQLSHIKHMEKHFKSLSNNYPDLTIKLEEIKAINYNEVETNEKTTTNKKIRNEFDESSERSTIPQNAKINYEQLLGKNKPSESVKLTKEELLEAFFITLCTAYNSNLGSTKLLCDNDSNQEIEFSGNMPESIEVY